ncbi:MAG: asparagine synthase-related protein [Luteimonas sp.]
MQDLQIIMSPYFGKTDFSALAGVGRDAPVDIVSVADLLRNGFVYPPHSVFKPVKLVTFNFDPAQDMRDAPRFEFRFRRDPAAARSEDLNEDWVDAYHRLLCGALENSCRTMRSPWLLQSGGKDSTTLAIAAADSRPDITCITYLGGSEENEVVSARSVALGLGLRHETLLCDSGRAYDRYLAIVDRMPLLTADFALLSYVDLASTIADSGGDGVVDGVGSDNYFGLALQRRHRWLTGMARNMRLPGFLSNLPVLSRNFELSYALSTLQMDPVERVFPGSRFTDAEVDALFGRDIARFSRARLGLFREEIASAEDLDEWWAMASSIAGSAGAVGKGLFTTSALSLEVAYPFCDPTLREWVHHTLPAHLRIDRATRTNKVLVRQHIARRFAHLPYVDRKGSFRFDLRGLARCRFEQVHDFAVEARHVLPGARHWLEDNRHRLDNKYHASKFYLLAIVLPWITQRGMEMPS